MAFCDSKCLSGHQNYYIILGNAPTDMFSTLAKHSPSYFRLSKQEL